MKRKFITGIVIIACVALCAAVWPSERRGRGFTRLAAENRRVRGKFAESGTRNADLHASRSPGSRIGACCRK